MVGLEDRALHLEQIGRVAHVCLQVFAHLVSRDQRCGEHLLPGLQNRVLLVPHVQHDLTRVGVDRGLHRVADVVDVVQRIRGRRRVGVGDRARELLDLRVRVARRRRVGVDDPDDAAVDDRRVRVGVERQVRSDLLHALHRRAVVEDLRVLVDAIREDDLLALELDRVDQLLEQAVELRAALRLVGGERVAAAVFTAGREVELDRRTVVGAADDRVLGALLAEVDARLELAERTGVRDARLEEAGLTVDLALVSVRRHDAEAVRVDEGVRVPGGARLAALVELAQRDHGVGRLAVDHVAVDVQVRELVVLAHLLELREGVADERGVQDADVGGRLGVGSERARLGIRHRVVRHHADVVEAVRGAGGIDVALDVGRFERLLARLHLETLHERRVDRADHERGDEQRRRAEQRQAPAADDRRQQGEQRHEPCGEREDRAARDHGVDVGVGGAGDERALTEHGRVLVEPDADGLQGEVEPRHDREVDARGACDAHLATRDADAAVEVVGGERREAGDQDDGRGVGEDAAVERQLVHEERDVEAELRVEAAELGAVQELEHRGPARRGGDAHEQPEHERDPVDRQATQRLDHLLVAIQLRAQLGVHGTRAERDRDAHPDDERHGDEADREQGAEGEPLGGQHLQVAQLVEPEDVGVEAGEGDEADHDHTDDGGGHGKGNSGRAARGALLFGPVGGRSHGWLLSGLPSAQTDP